MSATTMAKKILPVSIRENSSAASGKHAALVRNDRGGIEVRSFASAADAAQVAKDRELPAPEPVRPAQGLPAAEQVEAVMGWRKGEMRHTDFARRLGISPRLVREQFKRGGLPGAKEHSAYILMVPTHLLRLAEAFGLRQVERLAKAGMIEAASN